jgi:hypothetical protein
MTYAYAKLTGHDLGIVRVSGLGLGNLLIPWARSLVAARRHGLRAIWPTWCQLRIGPVLRGEQDKKHYCGLFRATPSYVRGFAKLRLLTLAPRRSESVLASPGDGPEPATVIVFEGMAGRFAPILGEHQLVRQELLAITRPEHGAAAAWQPGPSVSVHVRLGDFATPGDTAPLEEGTVNLRIPIEWYRDRAEEIRAAMRTQCPVYVFSDGTDAELGPLLDLPGARRAAFGSSVADLWALSRSYVLVASGSTFSMWASYLGRMPVVWHRGQFRQRLYDEAGGIEVECEPGGSLPDGARERLARPGPRTQ